MNSSNWILKDGQSTIDCASFPYAFRAAYNLVRKTIEAKKDPSAVMKGITILGPINGRGERNKYTYAAAKELALGQGLLQPDGNISSREFKRR